MVLRRMSVPHHHLNPTVAQHRRQRYKVNSSLGSPCSPSVPEIVEAEGGNLAVSHGAVVGIVDLRDRAVRVSLTREDIGSPWSLQPLAEDTLGLPGQFDAPSG